MKRLTLLFITRLLIVTVSSLTACQAIEPEILEPETTPKKLIELSWDMPTPAFFRANIRTVEQRPFEGVVLKLTSDKTSVFKTVAYPDSSFTKDRQDLAATRSSVLTDNFLSVTTVMDDGWDWFNDTHWAATEKNLRNFAKTTNVGNLKGIFLDLECYGPCPWGYQYQPRASTKTFEQYQAQVRKRGAQFIKALQEEHPGITLFGTQLMLQLKGIYFDLPSQSTTQARLKADDYGLYAAFVNGMLDGVAPTTKLIDGNGWAHYAKYSFELKNTRPLMKNDAKLIVDPVNHAQYANVQIGHSVYSDGLLNLWNTSRFFGYALISQEERERLLEHHLYFALKYADTYAWFYSENISFWNDRNSEPAPVGILELIKRTKAKVTNGQPIGFGERFIRNAEVRFASLTNLNGRITTASGEGVIGVTFAEQSGSVDCVVRDSYEPWLFVKGSWTCNVAKGSSGKLTPVKAGYRFEPASYSYSNASELGDLNFIAKKN
jgi:hypothetical protein